MNHIPLYAVSVIARCRRFIQSLTSNSRVQGSTQQIINYAQVVDNFAQRLTSRSRHAHFIHMLDLRSTLLARALRGSERPLKRIGRSVAIVIGISLCLPMSHASSGSIDAIHPKDFIRLSMDKKEAICLIRLYGKESAFNPYAIGNLSGKYHTYGIPQLKNALIYDKTPIEQIKYGIKYIDHRYQGNACNAWNHWLRKGWH
jgi:hypothetical protein